MVAGDHKPGQSPAQQGSVWLLFPSQSAPPAKGVGSEQSLDLERVQSTPQEDQELQLVQPPARGVLALS